MPFERFDPRGLRLRALAERDHQVDRSCLVYPHSPREPFADPALAQLAERIVRAARRGSAVIFFCGAHVLRQGIGPLLIELLERRLLTHLALNGAGAIHDFELALVGKTCESVAQYVSTGQFGLWTETGRINEAAVAGRRDGIGLGEALGRMIETQEFPYRETSVLAAGYRLGVPVTVHVAIGQDIVHEHPNFDAAATGATTYEDFLIFAHSTSRLEDGVFLNIGSAVAGPEVYLKALAMARNLAHQQGRQIRRFTTAVFDIAYLGQEWHVEPRRSDPRYYFRPWKTVLVRTVAEGGTSFYVQGEHRLTIPALFDQIMARAGR